MHFRPGHDDHKLPFGPFKSCTVPRPIGWISSVSKDGQVNLAPFSQWQNIGFDPPRVMFSANPNADGSKKDTVVNVEETGWFVWNMATWALREQVNITASAVGRDVDEFELAGLTKQQGVDVPVPMVKESPVHFECRYLTTVHFSGNTPVGAADVVFGEVVRIHIQDDCITDDGRVDVLKLRPIARMGYYDYTSVESIFEMIIPDADEAFLAGLSGTAAR